MAIVLTNYKFDKVWRKEGLHIEFVPLFREINVSITAEVSASTHWQLKYFFNRPELQLSGWLDAFIDILPGYAAKDKYLPIYRSRTRYDHYSTDYDVHRWDILAVHDNFKIIVRTHFDRDEEDSDYYLAYHATEDFSGDLGKEQFCVEVQMKDWVAALVAALEKLIQACPFAADNNEEVLFTKEQFPQLQLSRLKAWLKFIENPRENDLKKLAGDDFPADTVYIANPE